MNQTPIERVSHKFQLEKVDYRPNNLKFMQVCSNIIVMGLENCHLLRLNLVCPQELEDIEIPHCMDNVIHKLFLDPFGLHLIVSLENRENYYIPTSSQNVCNLTRFKGVVIDSVAWDIHNRNEHTTGAILIGSKDGIIYECEIAQGRERAFKQIYTLAEPMPITGLEFERIPLINDQNKILIMASGPTRVYQFIGGPTFAQIFANVGLEPSYTEIPGNFRESCMKFFRKYPQGLPSSFCWLAEPGIYHGNLVLDAKNSVNSVTTDNRLTTYPGKQGTPPPIALTMTEFHFILLLKDRIQCINRHNEETVFEEVFQVNQSGNILGLAHDPINNTIWVYSDITIYEVVIMMEK